MAEQLQPVVQEKILRFLEAPLPKLTPRDIRVPKIPGKAMAVIGMRRSGKTSFLHQLRKEAITGGVSPERVIYFNFEDERLAGFRANDLRMIPETHLRLFPEPNPEPVTYYLDEIQLVPGWEAFVRRLLDEGESEIFLSGSSAKLLSREIATSMRGRGWEIPVRPFGFREYLRHHGLEIPGSKGKRSNRQSAMADKYFADWLETGGLPEAQGLAGPDRWQLLQGYVDVVLLRDIIERHGVTNVTALRWLTRRLLGNPGGLFSITKFEAGLKSQGIAVGRDKLHEMLAHLEDSFLLGTVQIATDSEKRRQVNPRKAYPADQAFGPVYDRSQKANQGHALEVAIHNELLRRKAEVAYVRTKSGYEIDFLSRNADGNHWLVQVCANVDDPDTFLRETRALEEATPEYPADRRLLLTADSRISLPAVPRGIEILPAWEWMLEEAG